MTESETWSVWLKGKKMSEVNAKIKEGLSTGVLKHSHIPIIYKTWRLVNPPERPKEVEDRKSQLDKLF